MINGNRMDFNLRTRIVERAAQHREQLDAGLAVKIINTLVEAVEAGRS